LSSEGFLYSVLFGDLMTISKKDIEKLRKGYRDELAILEEKCKAGNATKDEYAQLNKLRKKMK